MNRWCREIFAAPINFSGEFTDTILREARSCAHGRRFLSHGGDHYDHRTDLQSHDRAQNTAAARNTVTKVTTEENPSEYNPANVKAADKLDQTTAVVENAQSKDQNNTSADANSEQQQQVTNEQIKKAVEKLNKNMMSHSEAVFGIHEATNRITIKIIDKDTKKVIKELPPEKTLDMIAKVWELAGILVDEKR